MPTIDLSEGLSIVIPFFNEGLNTPKSANHALLAAARVSFPCEVIVVNDGSTDGIAANDFPSGVTYQNKEHSGRFATRDYGLRAASYPNILFLDARVWLDINSLENLEQLILANPTSKLWNGFIKTRNTKKALVSIWETLVTVGWQSGINSEETIHYGLKDFDRYPKGTTLFLAKKIDWAKAFESVDLNQSWASPISDDTRVLRYLAREGEIWIDSKFSAEYEPRTKMTKFIKNGFYRGRTFVDSYWESPTIFGVLVKVIVPSFLIVQIVLMQFADFSELMFANLLLLTAVTIGFLTYSWRKWRNPLRAIRESLAFVPLLFSFGFGLLIAYSFGLLNRLRKR